MNPGRLLSAWTFFLVWIKDAVSGLRHFLNSLRWRAKTTRRLFLCSLDQSLFF